MAQAEEHKIKEYLLGQLNEAEEEQVELRLLTDPDFAEEYDIVVNELTDDYVAGKFEGEELKLVDEHFFKSAQRRDKLKFAQALNAPAVKRLKAEMGAKRDKQRQFRRYLAIAAALVLLAVGGFYYWRAQSRDAELKRGLAALQSAFRDERPLEARISKFDYAPYLTTRGREPERIDKNELSRAELTLLEALKKNPTPAVHHALGKVFLTKKQFDDAIKQFDEALKADPNNAQLYSDLGAAWLEKGKIDLDKGKGMAEMGRSLENLNKALELNPNLLEALFNRALYEEQMTLYTQAENDWREYLTKDQNSAWANEARRKLKGLQEQQPKASKTREELLRDFVSSFSSRNDENAWRILSQNRDITGNPVENMLIDEYLDLAVTGHLDEGRKTLEMLSYAGELEIQRANDHFTSDLTRFYRGTAAAQWTLLANARKFLRSGRENLQGSKPEEAVENYARAQQIFNQVGDNCEASYVRYPLGHGYLLQSKSRLSLSTFEAVARDCEARNYKWLLAQTFNAIANVQIGLNNFSEAIETSNRSLKTSESIGDIAGIIKTTDQLAQEYFYLGNYDKSLGLHRQGLDLAAKYTPELLQIWRNHFTLAMPLNALGLSAAALAFSKESLQDALKLNMPYSICRSYIILGRAYGVRGDFAEASKYMQLASEVASNIQSPSARKESIAYSNLQLGHLERQAKDFSKAIDNYDKAIQLYSELDNFKAFNYVAHKGKLISCLAQGGCSSAEQEIETCLGLFESSRQKILEETNRDSFFDDAQSIYDVAIDFEYSKNNDEKAAFAYLEQSRSRSLLDLTTTVTRVQKDNDDPELRFTSVKSPVSREDILTSLSGRVQLIEYVVLEDKLLIWVLSKTGSAVFPQYVSRQDLNNRVLGFLRSISDSSGNHSEETASQAKALYDILIKPVESTVDTPLCIVPDKILSYLPFAALISNSGRYLIEDHSVTYAPSANMFVVLSKAALTRSGSDPERLLSVGNPTFDRQAFQSLNDLPSAAKEAKQIADIYGSSPLLGEQATKSRVKREIVNAIVVQLALHSIVDEQFPMRSKLLLAKDQPAGDPTGATQGVLQAYELYDLKLPKTRLVVLSSCQSGVGRYYGGEGMIGTARPFVAAQVPLVIASLWSVESDSTAELMVSFHRHRKIDHLSTAEALRLAQREMLSSADALHQQPYYWSPFVLIGGYTTY